MGNQTTNRLESFHRKVKAYLHPNMTLSNCVDELLHFDRRTTTESCSCECTCFMSQLLPCRHILTCLLQEETPFLTSWVPERWMREYNNNRTIVSGQVINVKTVTNGPKMTRREKFCEMNRLLRDIADMSADLGHHNFCSRFHFIVDLHKAWSQSKQECMFLRAVAVSVTPCLTRQA